jgi:uncharacterized protein
MKDQGVTCSSYDRPTLYPRKERSSRGEVTVIRPTAGARTTYVLFAESTTGDKVELLHRDPNLIKRVTSPTGHPELVTGPLTFRGQVGLTTFELRSAGQPRLTVELEVYPSKLDYASDYEALLIEVNSASRGLALEYLRSTHRHGASERDLRPSDVEFATLLRHHMRSLQRSLRWIGQHPHRQLLQTPDISRVEAIQRPSRLTKHAVRRKQGHGPFVQLPEIGPVHARLPGMRSVETLDTPEHRWLRAALLSLKRQISSLIDGVRADIVSAEAAGRSTVRLEAELAELTASHSATARMISSSPISEAVGNVASGFSSLTLLQMPGYREAMQAILSMNEGLAVDLGGIDISVKDLDVLYEIWCFLAVASLIYEFFGGEPDFSALFENSEKGLRTRLRYGSELILNVSQRDKYRLIYNKSYPGYTGTQRPDVVLVIEREGWPDMHVIFDAKYRLDASDTHIQSYGLPGPPQDAINALHRYRDAIVIDYETKNRQRPVVSGAALFPLDSTNSVGWPSSPLGVSLGTLGIGALPYLPSNENFVRQWLYQQLAGSSEELSSLGPEFSAPGERGNRKRLANDRTLLLAADEADLHGSTALDVRLGFEVPPCSRLVTVRSDGEGTAQTVLGLFGQIRSLEPASDGVMRIRLEDIENADVRLAGSNDPDNYPSWTTLLALDRARAASELGLGTPDEWTLVELLERRGTAFRSRPHRHDNGQLRTVIEVPTDDSPMSISHGADGFVLSRESDSKVLRTPQMVIDYLVSA